MDRIMPEHDDAEHTETARPFTDWWPAAWRQVSEDAEYDLELSLGGVIVVVELHMTLSPYEAADEVFYRVSRRGGEDTVEGCTPVHMFADRLVGTLVDLAHELEILPDGMPRWLSEPLVVALHERAGKLYRTASRLKAS
jgi:hypothetical protein